MKKNKEKIVMSIILLIVLILGGLIFVNRAFISAFMLWLSLFIFSICYYNKDNRYKKLNIILYILGILLIIGAIIYMVMRIV